MRWLQLYLRSRRILPALTIAAALIALMWALWLVYSTSPTIDPRMLSLTVMLAVAALLPTLSGADDALDRTAAVNWPARRAGHLLLAAAVIAALLLLTTATAARFGPSALVLRNTAGLLGLAALGAALLGTGRAWLAPLTWSLVTVMPFLEPSPKLAMQIAGWPIQPAGTTAATVSAGILAAAGLLAYTLRGCPRRPAAETAPDR